MIPLLYRSTRAHYKPIRPRAGVTVFWHDSDVNVRSNAEQDDPVVFSCGGPTIFEEVFS
jgi:hypothetical protein